MQDKKCTSQIRYSLVISKVLQELIHFGQKQEGSAGQATYLRY